MPAFRPGNIERMTNFERNLGFDPGSTSTSYENEIPAATGSSAAVATATSQASTLNGSDTGPGDETKMILEWVFAVSALFVIAALSLWRYVRLRRAQDNSIRNFVTRQQAQSRGQSRRTGQNGVHLDSNVPLTTPSERRRGTRAVAGLDVDSGGRRLGSRGETEGEAEDKDVLPAYDTIGSPPKYLELDIGTVAQGVDGIQVVTLPSMESIVVVDHEERSETLLEQPQESDIVDNYETSETTMGNAGGQNSSISIRVPEDSTDNSFPSNDRSRTDITSDSFNPGIPRSNT